MVQTPRRAGQTEEKGQMLAGTTEPMGGHMVAGRAKDRDEGAVQSNEGAAQSSTTGGGGSPFVTPSFIK